MQLEYAITPADHLESVKVRYRTSLRRLIMTFLGLVFLLMGIAMYPYFERSWSVLEISLSVWILLLQLFLPRIVHWLVYYRNREIFGPRKLNITEAGLVSDGPQGRIETPWSRYIRFRETKRLFMLYLSTDVKGIIPKRVFQDASQMDSFRNFVSARVAMK